MKDLTIDYALRATWQAVIKMYNEEAKNYGVTMAIGFTLLSIDPKGGTPSTALGPKMGMEATSLSRILKNIEEKGYIQRKPNPKDGRGVLIHLTPLGLEKRKESKDVVLRFNDVIKEHVSEADLGGFFRTIDVINKLISDKKVYIKTTK
ncbi:MarR family transcriptional regulator [Flagellimonas taeanensis]|jgi:DNA-binding MarR family transcriptional regulator|uniref:DNA-binding transcriptional regulator, MarR family n=1 Tax=Flagellimonas taeanensis TaxID=1005926 RepID=A0A1M7AEX0_9FLAO|nr:MULTISPECIES: MarR family transcriptional regulator [Allomuricauda]MDC6384801.1 MarR family transcriptional regulator [Muricauda sp. SK9]MEE1962615.1 MarR family transcriptional regulator [Allomuricauda taeanensis]RIV53465.1 MarR family transcriptional regulator [Allomuricauda taeanensis]SFC33130.1 DNA-binding transcriptional regulator, MarR family [Allomuricauda taeanensis]SHL41194.1 DNA-binding transcriptional regulator, MarR family [Allomuricauda taeanensis]